MRNFKELKIWQKGIEIALDTYKLIDTFPKPKNIVWPAGNKSSISIPSNIAEGSSRRREKTI